MTNEQEQLGQQIDTLDSLAHALNMPLPPEMHVNTLRTVLPDLVTDMRAAFVALTGENPWSSHS